MNCIGIIGEAGSGKDTTAKLLQIELGLRQDILATYAFAAPIYQFVSSVFDIPLADLNDRTTKEVDRKVKVWDKAFKQRAISNIQLFLSRYAYRTQQELIEVEVSLAERYNCATRELYNVLYNTFITTFYYQMEPKVPLIKWLQELFFKDYSMTFATSTRDLLQRVGTQFFRVHVDENFWTIIAPSDDVIFTDVRFPNEVTHVLQNEGIIIKINNPELEKIPKSDHESESYFDDMYYDYVLYNDGKSMDTLIKNVESLVTQIYGDGV